MALFIRDRRFGVRIRECYGMTEAASFTTINLEGRLGSIGRPVPHFELKLEVGEIVVREREPGLFMRGYWKDPERTAEALRDGWLYTGDFGTCDADHSTIDSCVTGDVYEYRTGTRTFRCASSMDCSSAQAELVAFCGR